MHQTGHPKTLAVVVNRVAQRSWTRTERLRYIPPNSPVSIGGVDGHY